jgi:hypothetical protein
MAFAHNTLVDPLAAFIDGAVDGDRQPVPLIATRFDVTLAGGLAVVNAIRVFRNGEAKSIEATITLPVPVHAQVFGLSARIGERTLNAVAKAKAEARETYEDAVDRGKAAVLHEEALRGVHVLSVAHIAPGEEIEVRVQWVESLRAAGERLKLRIPTTLGEIYGRSPLIDVDNLLTGGEVQIAQLSITSEGPVWLGETRVEGGHASVSLNRPIDLSIPTALPRTLVGLAAGGGRVCLAFSAAGADEPLDLAILVDRSGSMNTRCSAGGARTKHEAVVEGLAAASLGAADRIHLWQFDNHAQQVGETHGTGLPQLTAQLAPPQGGTEIGQAISTVIGICEAADILVITDGQSHALDVQALARHGRRISVVLVGEDSLEARIGHLAALTGGEIFVASDADIPAVIQAAFTALRGGSVVRSAEGVLATQRGGLVIEAVWNAAETEDAQAPELARAVAAFAASLRLPTLTEAEAAQLAEREGLVTHLTSLVLVDEAGPTQEDLPAQRKVALPEPAVLDFSVFSRLSVAESIAPSFAQTSLAQPPPDYDLEIPSFLRRLANEKPPAASSEVSRRLTEEAHALAERARQLTDEAQTLAQQAHRRAVEAHDLAENAHRLTEEAQDLAAQAHHRAAEAHDLAETARQLTKEAETRRQSEETSLRRRSLWGRIRRSPERRADGPPLWLTQIDWAAHGAELAAGGLKSLPPLPANALASISRTPWATEKAPALGMAPLLFAILAAALAAEANGDRGAGRVARRLLGGRPRSDLPPISEFLAQLGTV